MFIRAYLRASTDEQNAERAKEVLTDFIKSKEQNIASYYIENESGAKLDRPELNRLLGDCQKGDVLLIESIDRLTRLSDDDWDTLKQRIDSVGVRVVAIDLPTSHIALNKSDGLTDSILNAINKMMIDLMAVYARKDYELRRERQKQGIERAKELGKYKGREINTDKYKEILGYLAKGYSHRDICKLTKCSLATIQSAKKWDVDENQAKKPRKTRQKAPQSDKAIQGSLI